MTNLHNARVTAAAKAYQAAQNADPYDFKGRMSAALAAADAVVTVEMITGIVSEYDAALYSKEETCERILALLRGGEERCRDCSRTVPARDTLCRNCLAKSEVGG